MISEFATNRPIDEGLRGGFLKMKKKDTQYGQPIFLYPGITLRVGSIVQISSPSRVSHAREIKAVDKFVDKVQEGVVVSKNNRSRPDCPKNRH